MRCIICDKDSDTVSIEDPCSDCQQAIFECIAGYPPVGEAESDIILLEADFDVSTG